MGEAHDSSYSVPISLHLVISTDVEKPAVPYPLFRAITTFPFVISTGA